MLKDMKQESLGLTRIDWILLVNLNNLVVVWLHFVATKIPVIALPSDLRRLGFPNSIITAQ